MVESSFCKSPGSLAGVAGTSGSGGRVTAAAQQATQPSIHDGDRVASVTHQAFAMPSPSRCDAPGSGNGDAVTRTTEKEILSCLIELLDATHKRFPCMEIRIVSLHLEYLLFVEQLRRRRDLAKV